MDPDVEQLLTQQEEQEIVNAIRTAEGQTSGEIRVHIERTTTDAMQRAQEVFHLLKMDNTALKNGVLFYFAVEVHKFTILGDSGIDERVDTDFWNQIRDNMQNHFVAGEFCKGIVQGIRNTGLALAKYFPWEHDDINELPDEITTEDLT